jgi:hypothetical protein
MVAVGSAATTTTVYDDFKAPYTLSTYQTKWANPYGLGDMGVAPGDTRSFGGGVFQINDAPFRTSFDYSVFDHLKYIAVSKQAFPVPTGGGSVTFSSQINANTPGTQVGRTIAGTYGPPGSYPSGSPYSSIAFEGQQAGAVMNMINFATGQLFDWFISGNRAFTLVERLPSSVTNPALDPSDADWVGPGKMYTQIVDEFAIKQGIHRVAIQYTKNSDGTGTVTFILDGTPRSTVTHVGLPLDSPSRTTQIPWTHVYPSATYVGGPPAEGEELGSKIDGFVFGHGTFSLLDEFPYQWGYALTDPAGNPKPYNCFITATFFPNECASGSVSIPVSQRLFGQGARATFDNFTVTTTTP